MKSTMTIERCHVTGKTRFKGEIYENDLAELNLDQIDKMVLADCFACGRTAADWLLGLELIFRRLQEQNLTGDEHARACRSTEPYV